MKSVSQLFHDGHVVCDNNGLEDMKHNRWFFLLLLPVLWSAVSLLHFHWPGDEYAMWAISSMAGAWVLFLKPNVGDIHQWWIRCSVATAGFFVMGGAGWLLCWLKVRVRIWLVFWLGSSVGWMGFMLMQYPRVERALAKNGSWAAYLFTAILLATYSATLLTIMGGGIKRLSTKNNPASASDSSATSTDAS